MVSDARISTPPMVGVPFFSTMWRSGPSSRMGWPPRWMDFNQRMTTGPSTRLRNSAVRQAATRAEGLITDQVCQQIVVGEAAGEVEQH